MSQSDLENKFTDPTAPTAYLPHSLLGFKASVKPDLKALVDKGWSDIYWGEVVEFKEKVYAKIDKFITANFDDRLKLATEALEQAIAFYNDFLERQE